MRLLKLGIPTFFLLLIPAYPAMAATITEDDVASKLICECGCTAILNNCTHIECSVRETMLTTIKQKIAQGQSANQIIQAFVRQYGEKVLAEPPKRGFNLTAWLSPFAGLLIGAGLIYLALKKWLKRGESATVAAASYEADEEYRQRIEQELNEFPEKGFR